MNFRPALPCAKVMKSPLAIGVVPSFWNSVPLVMLVILKCVTSAPSPALRQMTRPLVVCVSSSVVALVTDGVSATALTVIVAVTALPPSPASALLVEACTSKLPVPEKLAAGVNFRPALPWAKVMKSPLAIGVVPSFWNSVPLVMLVILKCVTSAPSAALRLMTRPDGRLRVLAGRRAGDRRRVGDALTVMVAVAVPPPRPASTLLSEACTSKLNAVAGLTVRGRREFQPGVALREGDEVAVVICVVPSFWNSVPPVMVVILKCVTSAPSPALRVMTRPLVVCVSSLVVASVTDGVSATALTVIVAVTRCRPGRRRRCSVEACTSKLPVPEKLAEGVNFSPALP